ncbi:MAG: FtsH protease activity modulator HflK [Candidatus Cloacimonetes bacterium]|nr:FtsH protease activity modulator HflK [Candidatus Cloacimonadota bacterium]
MTLSADAGNVKDFNTSAYKNKIMIILIIIIAGVFIGTGLYTVQPEEVGVIQRFGKFNRLSEPGLRFKIPLGIETLTKVKVKHVFKEEFGFRTIELGKQSRYSTKDYTYESLILTGDLNIADVEWIVQYQIKDPAAYLFNVRDVEESIRNLSESTIRQIIGDRSVDEAIVLSRQDIAYQAKLLLQSYLDDYGTGIDVVTINLQNVNPPVPVQPAFNDVNAALQEEERIVNEAQRKYNDEIPKARGIAKQVIEQAEGYAINRTNRASGDAERFIQVLQEYTKAKQVTKKRMMLETYEEVLPLVEKIYIVDENQKGLLPILNLDKGAK